MTREELIPYCRYYKGEEENPFDRGSDEGFFWSVEKMYVRNAEIYGGEYCKGRERCVQNYIDSHPNEKNIYTDKNVSIHTKGIAYFIEDMSAKWIPFGPNRIFKY